MKIFKIFLIIVLILQSCIKGDVFTLIYNQISNHLKPHQVIFLYNNFTTSPINVYKWSQKMLRKEIPRFIISKDRAISADNRFGDWPIFKSPRHVSLDVIFDCTEDFNSSHFFLHWLFNLTRPQMQAHNLIISFFERIVPESKIHTVLKYGWTKKFLDLSVLAVNSSEDISNTIPILYSYDPFRNFVMKKMLNSDAVKLFPYKLNNAQGYPFKLPLFDHPPYDYIGKDEHGAITQKGGNYPFIEFALKTMNFTIVFPVEIKTTSTNAVVAKVRPLINSGDINMWISVVPMKWLMYFKLIIVVGPECEKMVAVTPVIPVNRLNISIELIYYVLVAPTLILLLTYILSVFKIIDQQWIAFDIIKMLMGTSINIKSSKTSTRLVYLSILFASMKFADDLYSLILDIGIEQGEISFDNYEDLDRSELPVLIYHADYDRVFADVGDQYLQNLGLRSQKFEDVARDCMLENHQNPREKRICIVSNTKAEADIFKYRSAKDASLIMKIMQTPLICDPVTFVFETSSPYADRFAYIQRVIQESGIWYKMRHRNEVSRNETLISKGSEKRLLENFFVKLLAIILSIGYSVSIITFLAELLIARFYAKKQ